MAETKSSTRAWADTMAPNETERQRLRALSDIYDPDTIRHLEDLGVGTGWRCLEVGAGEGSIARWLSAHPRPIRSAPASPPSTTRSDMLDGAQDEHVEAAW